MSTLSKGVIKFFNKNKGFGFITDKETGSEVFVHATGLTADAKDIQEGDEVTFEITDGKRGPTATNVELV